MDIINQTLMAVSLLGFSISPSKEDWKRPTTYAAGYCDGPTKEFAYDQTSPYWKTIVIHEATHCLQYLLIGGKKYKDLGIYVGPKAQNKWAKEIDYYPNTATWTIEQEAREIECNVILWPVLFEALAALQRKEKKAKVLSDFCAEVARLQATGEYKASQPVQVHMAKQKDLFDFASLILL